MKAVFVLGSLERDALKQGNYLTKATRSLLRGIGEELELDVVVVVAIDDPLYAGFNKSKIGIEALRAERPRVLDEIGSAQPDFVMCFGPVATACVFDHGSLKESDLIRARHAPLGEHGPSVYVTYGMENARRSPGLRQWIILDTKAAAKGMTGTVWGDYTLLLPDDPAWHKMPEELCYLWKNDSE